MGWMALIDHNNKEIGVVGDDAWDIMGDAVQKIKEVYISEWQREPTNAELISIFEFVTQIHVST